MPKKSTSKKKTEEVVETTEVVVATPAPETVSEYFLSLDVSELNAAVEKIANRSTTQTMTAEEKNFALSIIDSWNTSVVEQITDESNKLRDFTTKVCDFSRNWSSLMQNTDISEPFSRLISVAGLEDEAAALGTLMNEYKLAEAEYDDLRALPLDINEETATEPQRIEANAIRQTELLKKRSARDAANRKLLRAVSAFNLALNENANVQTAITQLRSLDRQLANDKRKVTNKSRAAKLAISIDDPDLRTMLSELINISLKAR